MKPILIRAAAGCMAACLLNAAPAYADFVPDDQVISAPGTNMPDPEFDPVGSRLTWQDGAGNLWIAHIDPQSGLMVPDHGMGTMLDSGLSPIYLTLNGPEWGYGNGLSYVVYTRSILTVPLVGVASEDMGGQWSTELQDESRGCWRPFATPPATGGAAQVAYLCERPEQPRTLAWREVGSPLTELEVDASIADGARWVEGQNSFVTTQFFGLTSQVAQIDAATGQASQLTLDAGNKFVPFMWFAPELGEYLLLAQISNNELAYYREIEGVWSRIYSYFSPSTELPFFHSPEPFVHQGKSYIVTVLAQELADLGGFPAQPVGDTQIWIAGVDSAAPFFRRVDDPSTTGHRIDPEALGTDIGTFVYYSEQDENSVYTLRRAATGLMFPMDSDADGVDDAADNCSALDNPDQRDTDGDGFGNLCDPDLNNDMVVDFADLTLFKEVFFSANADADFDGSGTVDFPDLTIFKAYFSLPPGPGAVD